MRRRDLLASVAAMTLFGRRGFAASNSPIQVHVSYGQSWRSNAFGPFASFGWHPNPRLMLACHLTREGPRPLSGPLSNGAGIWLPGTIDGITGYTDTDSITIGRCAVLTQQLLRSREGLPQAPILEFCAAYPGSTWTTGKGGGLRPGGVSWTNMLRVITALREAADRAGRQLDFRSVGYTQGGSEIDTAAAKVADLKAMCAQFDALRLPGLLKFYLEIAAPTSNAPFLHESIWGTYAFCRENANRRSWAVSPWYQWPFDGASNIHLNGYGSARLGEAEGYAQFVVEDEGAGRYTPLWRSLNRQITISGQRIVVPFDRPSGRGFVSGRLDWRADPEDGIKVWPQYGWHVRRGKTEFSVKPSISGLDVILDVAEPLGPGAIEVSYAFYGPGGPAPGLVSGVGGNLMMTGPPSPLFPGKTINAWAWPFHEMITVP